MSEHFANRVGEVAAVAGTMIGLKKGLCIGVAIALSVVLIRYVVYHFAFRRPN